MAAIQAGLPRARQGAFAHLQSEVPGRVSASRPPRARRSDGMAERLGSTLGSCRQRHMDFKIFIAICLPRGHLKLTHHQRPQPSGDFSLQGSPWKTLETHDAGCHGVYPPIPAARLARWVHEDSSLRIPQPQRQDSHTENQGTDMPAIRSDSTHRKAVQIARVFVDDLSLREQTRAPGIPSRLPVTRRITHKA